MIEIIMETRGLILLVHCLEAYLEWYFLVFHIGGSSVVLVDISMS